MRLAFFVNDVATEIDEYATTRLSRAASRSGHEVWYIGVGDVELGESDGQLVARAHAAEFNEGDTLESFMTAIKDRDAERIVMDDLDALFLRNDSIDDLQQRPWASPLGAVFGQMLLSENADRASKIDGKATNIVGYAGVLLAFLTTQVPTWAPHLGTWSTPPSATATARSCAVLTPAASRSWAAPHSSARSSSRPRPSSSRATSTTCATSHRCRSSCSSR